MYNSAKLPCQSVQKKCAGHGKSSKLMPEWLQHVIHCQNNIFRHSANRTRSSFHIKSELFVKVECSSLHWIQQFFQMPGIFILAISDLKKWQVSHPVCARGKQKKNILRFSFLLTRFWLFRDLAYTHKCPSVYLCDVMAC